MMKLKGKVAIVTGSSAGMGRDTAYLFAKEGATVYAVARRVERLEELAKKAEGLEGKIIPYGADLMNKEEAEKDIPKMREKGYMVKEQYQSENTYVVSYHKDTL